jgi:hypothetical protein
MRTHGNLPAFTSPINRVRRQPQVVGQRLPIKQLPVHTRCSRRDNDRCVSPTTGSESLDWPPNRFLLVTSRLLSRGAGRLLPTRARHDGSMPSPPYPAEKTQRTNEFGARVRGAARGPLRRSHRTGAAAYGSAQRLVPAREDRTTPVTVVRPRRRSRTAQAQPRLQAPRRPASLGARRFAGPRCDWSQTPRVVQFHRFVTIARAGTRPLSRMVEGRDGLPRTRRCPCQAIAKAGAVRGNAARLVRAPVLCLCKRRNRRGLAARMLLVLCEREPRIRHGARSRASRSHARLGGASLLL